MTTLPSMNPKNPWETIQRLVIDLQQQVAQIRSSMGTLENAAVGKGGLTLKDSGALTMLDEAGQMITQMRSGAASYYDPSTDGRVTIYKGRVYFWDVGGEEGDTAVAGQIMVDQGAGRNVMRLFPPHLAGALLDTSFTMRGRTDEQTGMAWLYTDGDWLQEVDGLASTRAASIILNTTGGELGIYGLPTTSGGYLLRYNQVGGKWTMALDSSSERYKTDIEPVEADYAQTVLQWEPMWFRMREEVAAEGDAAPRYLGFIAEQIDELTPEVVVHDEQGRPDALNKADMVAGLHVLARVQQGRLDAAQQQADADHKRLLSLQAKVEAQSQEIAALKDANTALGLRLDKVTAALKKLGVTV